MPFPDREISFSYGLFSLKSFSGQARFIKNHYQKTVPDLSNRPRTVVDSYKKHRFTGFSR